MTSRRPGAAGTAPGTGTPVPIANLLGPLPPEAVPLRLMATSDLHVHVLAWDYYADRGSKTAGLARTAELIAAARAGVGQSLLLDNGDYLQGNPLGDLMAERGLEPDTPHPMIGAMNDLGYDCGTLGNHEFNYGVPFLNSANAGANFPIVCANLARCLGATPTDDDLPYPPYALLTRHLADGHGSTHALTVGVLGLLPPQVLTWDRRHLEGFCARDMVEAAAAWVPHLRAAAVDVVVVLCHAGIEAGPWRPRMENAAAHVAALPGVDALVAGHTHLVFPPEHYSLTPADAPSSVAQSVLAAPGTAPAIDPVAGTLAGRPAVMPGYWGSHLGIIDLALLPAHRGWRVAQAASRAFPVRPEGRGDPSIARAADQAHRATRARIAEPVAATPVALQTYTALLGDTAAVRLVNDAQTWWTRATLGRGIPGADHARPILSAAAPFKAGGRGGPHYFTDIAAGPICLRHVADLYLYPNTLRLLELNFGQVAEWLERSAAVYAQVTPGHLDQPLFAGDAPSYNFDVVGGLAYHIDPSQPSRYDGQGRLVAPGANRIKNLTWKGAAPDPDAPVYLATNTYRAGGGGDFPGAASARVVCDSEAPVRDILADFLRAGGADTLDRPGSWRFAPMPGTGAVFTTGPGARAVIANGSDPRLEVLEENADGTLRCRLAF
ncbi:MAG: bifunctional 2',3'-cyclic-nucleotide 2'-phosphodiesterase/3'-nucleotidase [Pseudomonadota bacterium]